MTEEQAIKGLKENLCSLCAYGSQNMDSCDIRECDNRDYIKALERQSGEDCVSRADVRHLIAESFEKNLLRMTFNKMFETLYKGIDELPPVIPTHCIATVRFSKEDLREICNERIEIACEHGICKECKHFHNARKNFNICDLWTIAPTDNHYCADFEKRGNENEIN